MADETNPFLKYVQPAVSPNPDSQTENPFLKYSDQTNVGGDQAVSNAVRQLPAPDAAQAVPSAPTVQTEQPKEDVSVAGDVAKSAGIGLAQGALGLATLPGNIETLGRMGIDKGASLLGLSDPGLGKNHFLPNYGDAKSFVEGYTGEFYEPKTIAGKYARTIGEFAPLAAFGPGGVALRATNVLAPALASETAGQLTEGTALEPWARAGAGLAGGFVPSAFMRTVTPAAPAAQDAVRAAHIARLEQEGVDALTAGQRLGNRRIQGMEDAANLMPFGGARTSRLQEQSADQFTEAALRHAGVANANRANAPVIDQAFTDLGQQFNGLAARNHMQVDQPFLQGVRTAIDDYNSITAPSMRPPMLEGLFDDFQGVGGQQLDGRTYQALRSRIEAARRGSVQTNPQFARALGEVRDNLDAAMARSASPADQAAWQQARLHYRNLLAIEKAMSGAGENTANGLISPSQLRTAVKGQNKRTYVRGQNELGELAKAGESILKPLKSSGTAERNLSIRNFENIGKIGTLGVGGSLAGGFLGIPMTAAGVAAATLPGAAARVFMSRPMQRYLDNDLMVPAINAYEQSRLGVAYRVPQVAQGIVGGIGPRYDDYGNLR